MDVKDYLSDIEDPYFFNLKNSGLTKKDLEILGLTKKVEGIKGYGKELDENALKEAKKKFEEMIRGIKF